jgi:hypothetical protein
MQGSFRYGARSSLRQMARVLWVVIPLRHAEWFSQHKWVAFGGSLDLEGAENASALLSRWPQVRSATANPHPATPSRAGTRHREPDLGIPPHPRRNTPTRHRIAAATVWKILRDAGREPHRAPPKPRPTRTRGQPRRGRHRTRPTNPPHHELRWTHQPVPASRLNRDSSQGPARDCTAAQLAR